MPDDDAQLDTLKEALFTVFKGDEIDMPDDAPMTTEEAQDALRDNLTDPLADVIHDYVVARTSDWWGFEDGEKEEGGAAEPWAEEVDTEAAASSNGAHNLWTKKMFKFLGGRRSGGPLWDATVVGGGDDPADGYKGFFDYFDAIHSYGDIWDNWIQGMDDYPGGADTDLEAELGDEGVVDPTG